MENIIEKGYMKREYKRVNDEIDSIINKIMDVSNIKEHVDIALEYPNSCGTKNTIQTNSKYDEDTELVIYEILYYKDKVYFMGENINGSGNTTVYEQKLSYDKPLRYKKRGKTIVFNDKYAFKRIGTWNT